MIWLYLWLISPAILLIVYIIYTKTSGNWQKLVMLIGAPIDLIVNLSWFTLIFWELPKELLLTKRVSRLKTSIGYRGWLAVSICHVLNHFEANHCA